MLNKILTNILEIGKLQLNTDTIGLVLSVYVACSAKKGFSKGLILSTKPRDFWRKRRFPPKTPAIHEFTSGRLRELDAYLYDQFNAQDDTRDRIGNSLGSLWASRTVDYYLSRKSLNKLACCLRCYHRSSACPAAHPPSKSQTNIYSQYQCL